MSSFRGWINRAVVVTLLAGPPVSQICFAAGASGASPQNPVSADSGLYLKVCLPGSVKLHRLKAGDQLVGSLARDAYSADRKVFAAGSPVRVTVDHLEKRRRAPNDHFPWVIKVFTPKQENYPVFKTAFVSQAAGESSMPVSVISITRMREVHAQAKKNKSRGPSDLPGSVETSKPYSKKAAAPMMVLEASGFENPPPLAAEGAGEGPEPDPPTPRVLPAATRCKILLLDSVSASRSKPGDAVRARLLEPVLLDSRVILPAGSLFQGKVLRRTPPRWLSRAGSLYLAFTDLTLPEGTKLPIAASVAGAELDQRSHTRIDAEGQLRGERPGKAWMAINLGVTAGIAKEVDDGVQFVIEAIVSSATDASTAGTSRIVASCVSGLYMATRRGRDVVLPRFTEMDLALDRPLMVPAATQTAASPVAAGGK